MSFVHHLKIGCFELHPVLLCPTAREPVILRPLDRDWVERRLAEADPPIAEQFWFSDTGCLWSNWYGAGARRGYEVLALAREIASRHGPDFVVIHHNGEVLHPEDLVERQRRQLQDLDSSQEHE